MGFHPPNFGLPMPFRSRVMSTAEARHRQTDRRTDNRGQFIIPLSYGGGYKKCSSDWKTTWLTATNYYCVQVRCVFVLPFIHYSTVQLRHLANWMIVGLTYRNLVASCTRGKPGMSIWFGYDTICHWRSQDLWLEVLVCRLPMLIDFLLVLQAAA